MRLTVTRMLTTQIMILEILMTGEIMIVEILIVTRVMIMRTGLEG